jgi:hypothetical protein
MDFYQWLMQSKPTDWLGPLVTAAGFFFLYGQLRASTRQAATAANNYQLAQLAAERSAKEAAEQQNWKKAEFLAQQVKEFYADNRVERVTYMLDWAMRKFQVDGQTVLVFHDAEAENKYAERIPSYTQLAKSGAVVLLTQALRQHDLRGFTEREQWIRDEFDWLFFKLDQFQHLIDSKLVSFEEVDVHLKYLLDLLTGGHSWLSSRTVTALATYLELYDFEATKKLTESRIRARSAA